MKKRKDGGFEDCLGAVGFLQEKIKMLKPCVNKKQDLQRKGVTLSSSSISDDINS